MKKGVLSPLQPKKSGLDEDQAAFRTSFGERLARLLDQFPTRMAASEVAGVNVDMLAKYVKGDSKPPLEVIARLCDAKNFSLDWLTWGEARSAPGKSDGDVVMVPVWDVVASSGPGRYHIGEERQAELTFSRGWLMSMGIPLTDLHVVFNSGDSNAPAINDGDALLVWRGIERLERDAFYVFESSGVLLVKQIERRPDGSVVIHSRNPNHSPDVIPAGEVESLHIFGKVMLAGGQV